MTNPQHALSFLLFLMVKICLADNENIQDFCPTAFQSSNDWHYPNSIYINGYPCKNPTNVSASDFKTSHLKRVGDTDNFLRSSTNIVTAAEFPGLNTLGLALARTDLEVDGIVSPHSHPRAAEILFVSKGAITVGFMDTTTRVFQKDLREGDVFIVPKGMLHYYFNVGYELATIMAVHNSQNPGLIDISGALFGSGTEGNRKVKERLATISQRTDDHGSKLNDEL